MEDSDAALIRKRDECGEKVCIRGTQLRGGAMEEVEFIGRAGHENDAFHDSVRAERIQDEGSEIRFVDLARVFGEGHDAEGVGPGFSRVK